MKAKEIQIFEPAMCCETGLCGVSVDPELLRISTVINTLKEQGITIERFNLSNAPQVFVDNKVVNDFINQYDVDNLPVTLVDGQIKVIGRYPSNADFTEWLALASDVLNTTSESCGCGSGDSSESCCDSGNSSESCCGSDESPESCCDTNNNSENCCGSANNSSSCCESGCC